MSQPERKDSHIEVLETPTEFWGLKYREGGRQNLAVSFDGPPSPAYQAFIKKSAYDALKLENERLKGEVKSLKEGEFSAAKLFDTVRMQRDNLKIQLEQLEDESKRRFQSIKILAKLNDNYINERDRALEMLKKMAGALGKIRNATGTSCYCGDWAGDTLAEYRKEFGPQSNVLTENKLD